jgi:hypothetical protein
VSASQATGSARCRIAPSLGMPAEALVVADELTRPPPGWAPEGGAAGVVVAADTATGGRECGLILPLQGHAAGAAVRKCSSRECRA